MLFGHVILRRLIPSLRPIVVIGLFGDPIQSGRINQEIGEAHQHVTDSHDLEKGTVANVMMVRDGGASVLNLTRFSAAARNKAPLSNVSSS